MSLDRRGLACFIDVMDCKAILDKVNSDRYDRHDFPLLCELMNRFTFAS